MIFVATCDERAIEFGTSANVNANNDAPMNLFFMRYYLSVPIVY